MADNECLLKVYDSFMVDPSDMVICADSDSICDVVLTGLVVNFVVDKELLGYALAIHKHSSMPISL